MNFLGFFAHPLGYFALILWATLLTPGLLLLIPSPCDSFYRSNNSTYVGPMELGVSVESVIPTGHLTTMSESTFAKNAPIHQAWFVYPKISEYLDLSSLWKLSMTCKDFLPLRKFAKSVKRALELSDIDQSKPLLVTHDKLCDEMQSSFVRHMTSKNIIYTLGLSLNILEHLQVGFPHVELYFRLVHFGAAVLMPRVDIPIDRIHLDEIKFTSVSFSIANFRDLKEVIFSNCIFNQPYHTALNSESLQHLTFANCHFGSGRFRIFDFLPQTLRSITFRDCTFQNEVKLFENHVPNVECKIIIENCPDIYVPTIIVKKRKNIE